MAIFRKISNGLEMQGCDLYHYLLTNKGYCCEKGWNWEDLDTMQIKQGREWLAYWEQYGNPCSDQNVPINVVPPTIVNLDVPLVIGSELAISSNGTWTSDTGVIGYEYQWFRNGSAIVGETSPSYIVAVADTDAYLLCKVRAQDSDGWSLWASSNQILVPLFWGVSGGIWGTATNNVYA